MSSIIQCNVCHQELKKDEGRVCVDCKGRCHSKCEVSYGYINLKPHCLNCYSKREHYGDECTHCCNKKDRHLTMCDNCGYNYCEDCVELIFFGPTVPRELCTNCKPLYNRMMK